MTLRQPIVRGAHEAPAHLFPVEAEREVVSGALRAGSILQNHPDHPSARAALAAVLDIDGRDFSQRAVATIVDAIQSAVVQHGSLSIGTVLSELRLRRAESDAFRMLETAYDYGLAPVVGMAATIKVVRRAAQDRRDYAAHLNEAASIAGGHA